MSDTVNRDPQTQFQIGDHVTYLPEGVRTEITGYRWLEAWGGNPKIIGYELACGTTVCEDTIARTPAVSVRYQDGPSNPPPITKP